MWNDTDTPLAFLITFRTYGTWLHGDERTSVDRHNNAFGSPRIPTHVAWHDHNRKLLKYPPVELDLSRRNATEAAIIEVCSHRNWKLRAQNIRTNHAHVVVSTGDCKPERPLNAFKAYSTRKMRAFGCWDQGYSPWADKGSERWLWTEQSVANACDYVIYGQGGDLREFDEWESRLIKPDGTV